MNALKTALAERRPQIGLWQALANPYTAEICAGAGYDWLLFDGEHAPNTVQTLLAQLQAVARHPVEPVVRPAVGDPAVIKQYLDIGFRSLLVPMVESAAQAEMLVAATRFPPRGIRGVASATSRASGFGADGGYLARAHEDICLIVQIESRAGLDAIEEIAAVDGVDALFIGPGDLAGALGHLGNPGHAEVQDAIAGALDRVQRAGKAAGIFALSPEDARARMAAGACFVSIGTDIGVLMKGSRGLLDALKG
ncbi:HpcH/HpaI aldolase family protein [Rhizorhabdus wittichii]|jgi:4-hydroxy-2-oxoheptanedioate aldolase|uniref:HpcH/HpaI aldolase/citrate lyase family protein n=1 Tax=Rhizorhabdus wittichii TaxID=160791 RepID=A0A975HFW1_9SPHN|nr:HpcH/HpaI aldolase/citrate lyase family protein [Rhizorhabdus wittichii]QTH23833.1 HpcH/HpaI aldolase/citrate lyase family protein [Rhizorhabdus wittichii]